MKKAVNKTQARLKKLADKYAQKINQDSNRLLNSLSEEQNIFIRGFGYDAELEEHLKKGKKPSDYFNTKGNWIFEECILKRHREALFYLIDNVKAFACPRERWKTSFRSNDYYFYMRKIRHIICDFSNINWMDMDYADFWENNLSEEQIAYKSIYRSHITDTYLLTYEIDMGNERVINDIKNALESGDDTIISEQIFSAIFQCKNTELHELVCKLLLTANPKEESVLAICQSYDNSRIEPFLMMLKAFRDNELIHYSSVKRVIGYSTGLLPLGSKDLERIHEEILHIIIDCLEDANYIEECLQEEDSMKIYIALWAIGYREIKRCAERLFQIIDHGSSQQVMAAGIFIQNNFYYLQIYFPIENILRPHNFAVQAVLKRHEELDVMAIYLPMMPDYNLGWSHVKRKHGKIDMAERYSREEAERLYVILNEMFEKLPKKKLTFNPCVFPWNTEYLIKSDVVKPLCVIAADLEDPAKIDETCIKIPLIRLRDSFYTGRGQAVRMLLSEPKTEIQLDTLVSLAADKEENTKEVVFTILNKCPLKEKHFRFLENMLRYKSAKMRERLTDVLFRQPEEQLFACVKRLCMDEKEEKRSAGLNLILKIYKSDRDDNTKAKYNTLLQFITNPSLKEQILIDQICIEN